MNSIWQTRLDQKDWENSECTCPSWSLLGNCKHVVALAISLDILVYPARLNLAPLRQPIKRKPQIKASKALERQPFYNYDSCTTTSNAIVDNLPDLQVPSQSSGSKTIGPLIPTPVIQVTQAVQPQSSSFLTPKKPRTNPPKIAHRKLPLKSVQVTTASPSQMPSLILFGSTIKSDSFSSQSMNYPSCEWTPLPPFATSHQMNSLARHNASYVYLGEKRVAISGGVKQHAISQSVSGFRLFFLIFSILFSLVCFSWFIRLESSIWALKRYHHYRICRKKDVRTHRSLQRV